MSGYSLTFTLPQEAIWLSVLIALIVSQVAAIPPALRAARVRILEAVQYE
jgi:ABC-type lipoprotein release transport system permease subunit